MIADPAAWQGTWVLWTAIVIVLAAVLAAVAVGRRRRIAAPPPDTPTTEVGDVSPELSGPVPPPAAADDGERDIAVAAFHHLHGAERAYAHVLETSGHGAEWLHEVSFVERHRHGRIAVRGTFAGHYLDVEDVGDAIGHDTAVGAIAGAIVGMAFGPVGLAAGLAGGGTVGGIVQSHEHAPRADGPLIDEIRTDVPEGSSALVIFAPPAVADAMQAALAGSGGRVVRHRLAPAAIAELRASVAQAPPAAPPTPA